MIHINDNFLNLNESYLFTEIARKVKEFTEAHPEAKVIKMGIGDVTQPLCQASIAAMHRAVDDQASADTFHGYGPEQGYEFLRKAIAENDYNARGIDISPDEIFVSDGAKSDTGNIGDIFSVNAKVAITDPVYPVYIDTNVMAGRAGKTDSQGYRHNIEYIECSSANRFIPALPKNSPDLIYLCYPNNPTGTSLTRSELKKWVDYALKHRSIILFDSAYERYITSPDVPHSIFEIEGAKDCAIEFRSFSKTAGFTGTRCGYTVVPENLKGYSENGDEISIRSLWLRRQCTKFNGASYIVQRGAEALYTPEGEKQVAETIDYYMTNATLLRESLTAAGYDVYGGIDAPYIWIKTPDGMSSWEFFDFLLSHYHIVGTPGAGFGPAGEGYLRLTAFNTRELTQEAVNRLTNNNKGVSTPQ